MDDFLLPFAEEWPAVAGIGETHIVMMNYDGYILIAKDIDLSKYSKAVVSYSTDASFTQEENEIGFFSKAAPFGHGSDRKTDGLIASWLYDGCKRKITGLYQERWKSIYPMWITKAIYIWLTT